MAVPISFLVRKWLFQTHCIISGDKFNLKQFHDVILGLAAVPLQVMEDAIDEMIEKVKDAQKTPSSVSGIQAEWMALSLALILAHTIGE